MHKPSKGQSYSIAKLIKYHILKIYWGVEVYFQTFLTLALDGGEWSASRLGALPPGQKAPGACCLGGLVESRISLP
jgi:hypothetical protein